MSSAILVESYFSVSSKILKQLVEVLWSVDSPDYFLHPNTHDATFRDKRVIDRTDDYARSFVQTKVSMLTRTLNKRQPEIDKIASAKLDVINAI
ncbi:hypothetical protein D3C84_918940 [compost metagenome]